MTRPSMLALAPLLLLAACSKPDPVAPDSAAVEEVEAEADELAADGTETLDADASGS